MEKLKRVTGQKTIYHLETFWARFMMITSKRWPLEHQQGFSLIWPGELVFDIKWPSFKLDLEIIKINILSNIYDDYFKNVSGRVLTRFSADLARWPNFWPQVTQFQTWPRNHQDKHVEQDSGNSFLPIWPGHLVFDPNWPSFKLEIIKTNISSKIHDDCFKNVTGRVLTRFSADLTRWPNFWPQETQFQTWPRNHQDKHVEQDSWWLLKKCDC